MIRKGFTVVKLLAGVAVIAQVGYSHAAPELTVAQGDLMASLTPSRGMRVNWDGVPISLCSSILVQSPDYAAQYLYSGRAQSQPHLLGDDELGWRLTGNEDSTQLAYTVRVASPQLTQIRLAGEWGRDAPAVLEFCAAMLWPELVRGRPFALAQAQGERTYEFPFNPGDRGLGLSEVREVVFHTLAGRLRFRSVDGTDCLRVFDSRAVPWEPVKGVSVGVIRALRPKAKLDIRVEMELLPPVVPPRPVGAAGRVQGESEAGHPALLPRPRSVRFGAEEINLGGQPVLVVSKQASKELRSALEILRSYLHTTFKVARTDSLLPRHGGAIAVDVLSGSLAQPLKRPVRPRATQDSISRPGGYRIAAKGKRVVLVGDDAEGLRNGVWALVQLLRRGSKGWTMPSVTLRDWPEFGLRGIHLPVFPGYNVPKHDIPPGEIKAFMALAARYRFNVVFIEFFYGMAGLKCLNGAYCSKAYSEDQIADLVEYGRKLGLTVCPGINSLGHADWIYPFVKDKPGFADMFEPATTTAPAGWTFCTTTEATYKFLFEVYGALLRLFLDPPYFWAGLDEASTHASCQRCKATGDPATLFARHVQRLDEFFRKRGVRMAIAGDMLLNPADFRGYRDIVANGGPPLNTWRALPNLPKDVLVGDWHYEATQFPTIPFFKQHGFEVLPLPWHNLSNIVALGREAQKRNCPGMVVTTWHTRLSAFPALAVAAESLWNPQGLSLETLPYNPALEVLLDIGQGVPPVPVRNPHYVPVDIASAVNWETVDKAANDGRGWLDYGPAFDLSSLPTGQVTLRGIPFLLPEGKCALLKGLIEPTKNLPSQLTVSLRKRADYVVLLLTATSEPPEDSTHVATITLHYVGGAKQQMPLLYGQHILGWAITGQRLLPCFWTGRTCWPALFGLTKRKARYLLWGYTLKVEHPDKPIESLVMESTGTCAAPAFFAATLVSRGERTRAGSPSG